MGCTRCGGRKAENQPLVALVPGYTAAVGPNGVYELASYLDCEDPYNGAHQRDDVFVIGLGTAGERLFTIHQRDDMLAYVKTSGLKLTRLTSHTLCHDAMVELFGS